MRILKIYLPNWPMMMTGHTNVRRDSAPIADAVGKLIPTLSVPQKPGENMMGTGSRTSTMSGTKTL